MIKGFGAKNVEVITFQYAQQHATELKKSLLDCAGFEGQTNAARY